MVKKRRRGGAKQGNQEAFWGNRVLSNPNDFLPAWVPVEDLPPPFDSDDGYTLPSTPGFLPLYLNNDETEAGTKIYTLILDSESPVGFSEETYVLNELLDTNPGNPLNFETISPTYDLSLTTLINQDNFPTATPQLVAGSPIKVALLVIEDAGDPTPIILGEQNIFVGSNGIDLIYAGDGQNTIYGNAGNDTLRGGKGDDNLWGDEDADNLLGEAGDDRLLGGDQADALYGGTGNDQLFGNSGNDILDGMEGDDVLKGGSGYDILLGSYGNDTLSAGNGGSKDFSLKLKNDLFGEDGNDTLFGGNINDLLDGGNDSDFMKGGLGDDTYVVDDFGDAIVENLDAGIDSVQSSIDWTLAAGLENLTLLDTALNGNGNAQDNTILGNEINNVLTGGAGNDVINGWLGSDRLIGYDIFSSTGDEIDTLQGGIGADTFVLGGFGSTFYQGSGYALIQDWEAGSDRIEVVGNADQYTLDVVVPRIIRPPVIRPPVFEIPVFTGLKATSTAEVNTADPYVAIYFGTPGAKRELIAIVQGNTDVSIARDFQFVNTVEIGV